MSWVNDGQLWSIEGNREKQREYCPRRSLVLSPCKPDAQKCLDEIEA